MEKMICPNFRITTAFVLVVQIFRLTHIIGTPEEAI